MRDLDEKGGPDPNVGGGTPAGEETTEQASQAIDEAQERHEAAERENKEREERERDRD